MKAITIKQPWAHLICEGIKDIENRTWKTNYRGKVYIHSSGYRYKQPWDVLNKEQNEYLMQNEICIPGSELEYSAIIGYVNIVDCVINHPSIWAEKSEIGQDEQTDEWFKPTYNWVLKQPVLFDKPIENVKGKLSFWDCSYLINSAIDDDGKEYCLCDLHIYEKDQVISMIDHFECKYCGGIWYK